jgi:hypothetical protein
MHCNVGVVVCRSRALAIAWCRLCATRMQKDLEGDSDILEGVAWVSVLVQQFQWNSETSSDPEAKATSAVESQGRASLFASGVAPAA